MLLFIKKEKKTKLFKWLFAIHADISGDIFLELLKMHLDEASLSCLLKITPQRLLEIYYLRITQVCLIFISLQ